MSNPWFRMYHEFATDPKVQVLPEALQRRYVMALCLHNANQYHNAQDDEIAFALRVTVEEWQETKTVLISRGLLNPDGSIYGWEKRQYISDIKDHSAAARQKRYRDRRRENRDNNVTRNVTPRNVTPVDTDTDTDTDIFSNENIITSETTVSDPKPKKLKVSYSDSFEEFWKGYPTDQLMSKKTAFEKWKRLGDDDQAKAIQSLPAFNAYCRANPNYRPVHACKFITDRRFDGFATTTAANYIPLVSVSQDSPAGKLWDEYSRATKGKGVPWTNGAWRFPTEYPPELRAAE